jgi:hypothetical protein
MRRILVVANQTATGSRLVRMLSTLDALEPITVRFVIPATALADQQRPLRHDEHIGTFGHTGAVALARHRLGCAIGALSDIGIPADGIVGDPDPLVAVREALTAAPADEIIISTLPRHRSRWVAAGVPDALANVFRMPVTTVEGSPRLLHGIRRGRPLRLREIQKPAD